ncbi:hypothetical protein IGA99_25280 [Pseudomonas aeruginosa]|uniref:hypothetical protein n=1 Tax=Pseudomonas aeruginosa TaxID=287 RepID=UPI0022374D83|nr:hypothetical protein [Pseudomonas aeruginosa]ELC0893064.1 hypothetical protein [Pseudomonas aeruginosa]MCW5334435.1 hypothetical protein [Pseudomonas aeruginosa]
MNKANECTCPSGDGSLRWPCPKHPAVEQAGGDERAAFKTAYLAEFDCDADGDDNMAHSNTAWRAWKMARAALARSEQEEMERLREAYERGYGDGQNNPNGYSDKKERDACVNELLKQPSTVQAEAERPEVVGYLATAEHPKHGQPHKAFNYFKDQHDAQVAHWRERGCTVTEDRLMTVSQHDRIVGELRAEIAEWQEAAGRSRSDVVAYIAERAKLLEERDSQQRLAIKAMEEVAALRAELQSQRERNTELILKLGSATNGWGRCEKERDAALARAAELEGKLAELEKPVPTHGDHTELRRIAIALKNPQLSGEEASDLMVRYEALTMPDHIIALIDRKAQHYVPEAFRKAVEWADHLLFECGALVKTRAPSVHVYNKAFAAVEAAKALLAAAPAPGGE